ncbi:MAG TPA: hypothetical protein VMH41_16915 [Mycobacteriales bacterium]|nr:hypothetical protein [Mycobacteriales bacterium]
MIAHSHALYRGFVAGCEACAVQGAPEPRRKPRVNHDRWTNATLRAKANESRPNHRYVQVPADVVLRLAADSDTLAEMLAAIRDAAATPEGTERP